MKILHLEIEKCGDCPYFYERAFHESAICELADEFIYTNYQTKKDFDETHGADSIPSFCPLPTIENLGRCKMCNSVIPLEAEKESDKA